MFAKYETLIKTFFSKLNSTQVFIVGLIITFMVFIYFSVDKLTNVFKDYNDCKRASELVKLSKKELEDRARNEVRLQETIDSILLVRKNEKSRETDQKKREIARELDRVKYNMNNVCLLYTSPSPRDRQKSRMPSSA